MQGTESLTLFEVDEGGGRYWYAAEDEAAAKELHRHYYYELAGELDQYKPDEVDISPVDDSEKLEHVDYGKMTARKLIEREGRGFVMTTEY